MEAWLRVLLIISTLFVTSAYADSSNESPMKEIPTAFLCSVIAPPAKIEHSEQLAINKELERRGQQCVNTKKS
jgi:hypothetical protein